MSFDPGAQEIVIDENVDNVLHSGALWERLQDPSLGEGTITLIIRDPNITIIGDMILNYGDREGAPLCGCESLLRVDLKGCTKLTQLGNSVFWGCSTLTSVALPDGLTQLGFGVFKECSSLTRLTLPDGLTQLGDFVFNGCSSLTSVSLPDGLTQLGDDVFARCSSLTSVSLPDGLTQLGNRVFGGCSSLTSVALPDGLTQLGFGVFNGCSSLTRLKLPDGLTQLGDSLFYKCSSLTSVSLPDGLTQLGYNVFVNCSSLTSVALPDGLTQLGEGVFYNCSSLTSAANSAGFSDVVPYLRDRYKCITLRKLVLRLLGKYNQAVNEANGTEAEKNAIALAYFPTDNSSTLDVGLFLQTMNASGGDGVKGLVGYILKFV